MKAILLFFVICAAIVMVTSLPTEDAEVDFPMYPRYNSYSYQYMMCRLKCRQSCLEKGFWKGVCKQGACFCYGPMGTYGQVNGYPMTTY